MAELNYHHLRYFWAVAHDGNLTRAAERLNLSQSALSVQIRQLEERLGHPLFERRGRQLFLTEAGRLVLDHADTIFTAGAELVASLKDAGRRRQVVRIGAMSTLSRNFQIGFLRPILGRTDIEVVLRSGTTYELLGALEKLNLDVVLLNHPPAADTMAPYITHRLSEQRVSLVGTPSLVGVALDLDELLRTRPLIVPTLDTNIRTEFDAFLRRKEIQPQIAAEVDDMAMIRLLARDGAGLAVIPPIVVKDELETGLLVEASRLPRVKETFFAVLFKRRFPNPLVSRLLEGY